MPSNGKTDVDQSPLVTLIGEPTRTNAEEALHSLLTTYGSIHPDSNLLLPTTDDTDREQLSRLVCSILLAGDAVQWGQSVGVYHAICGMAEYLGCAYLTNLKDISDDDLESAIWMTLRAVPERDVSDCRKVIRRYLHCLADGDLREARGADGNHVRQFVGDLTPNPVEAIFVLRALGHSEVRPTPTVGASLLLMRLEVLSAFEAVYFTDGYSAIQEEARRVLEQHPVEMALMAEWWGLGHCPESCVVCPAKHTCPTLCEGWI